MKKYWWVGVIIIFAIVFFVQKYKITKLIEKNQLQNVEISTMKDAVLTVVAKNGVLINKIESIEVDKRNLKDALEIAGFDKQELKDENIKLKNLNLALKAQIEATGNITTTIHDTMKIVNTDTLYYTKVDDWTDNRLSLYGGTISNNELNFTKYTFKAGFDFFLSKERNKSIVTVKFDNNKDGAIKLTTANSITIINKKKWYEKPWVWGLAGIGTGILITK